jgi:hypothetical protein
MPACFLFQELVIPSQIVAIQPTGDGGVQKNGFTIFFEHHPINHSTA